MATIQSSLPRFQTSTPATRTESGMLVTTVTPQRQSPTPIRQSSARSATLISMPKEPEDALLTGGTRSLDRRLLALNLSGSLAMAELTGPKAASERIVRQSAVA